MALKNKHQINFILEKRKDKATGQAITQNVPLFMTVTYSGNRLLFYTGYRIDRDKWIDKSLVDQTIYHEVVHAILESMGEDALSGNDKFVQNFALLLHQFETTKK